jgi:hypothetical protein
MTKPDDRPVPPAFVGFAYWVVLGLGSASSDLVRCGSEPVVEAYYEHALSPCPECGKRSVAFRTSKFELALEK